MLDPDSSTENDMEKNIHFRQLQKSEFSEWQACQPECKLSIKV